VRKRIRIRRKKRANRFESGRLYQGYNSTGEPYLMLERVTPYLYPIALALVSIGVAVAEHFFPWRKDQRQLRRGLGSDFLHLLFNGHFLGVILYGIATVHVLPHLDLWFARVGLTGHVYRNLAASWPMWVQIIVALLVVDFVQWGVHNLLHRVPFLWKFHQAHHSIVDGEMDWIVSFRFQWTEVVVYKSILYLPLAFFGFAPAAVLFHAIFGTLIGHLNHANLNIGRSWIRYVLNTPRMHIWHHDYDGDEKTTVNFGIIFSIWDWIFGTAKMPDHPPARLGFAGVEQFPKSFVSQAAWPLQKWLRAPEDGALALGLGYLLIGGGWYLHEAHASASTVATVDGSGERAASSQPAGQAARAVSPAEATQALARFGDEARAAGWAHPEDTVSADELAAAIGSPRLVLLDVRPDARFATGHIPSARRVDRSDYSEEAPIPGLSVSRERLEAFLRARGVRRDSVVVLYGDGGPEPYRLWWTLREVGGYRTRVLDGGMTQWKASAHSLVEGTPRPPLPGDVELAGPPSPPRLRWSEIEPLVHDDGAVLIDARSSAEYSGLERNHDAARAGHIPGARHLEWSLLLRSTSDPRLKPVDQLRALFERIGLGDQSRVITHCQSGTRSAVTYFALYQLGVPSERLTNYNGSWAEYSRLSLPVDSGGEQSVN
jgi:3-mercaptopyruvate sulfurtransferase SseA/sterol desaturase/sphingolipid hydroxylase (fatty acid hydroxylase superfamily)